jgi:hypothetical protein
MPNPANLEQRLNKIEKNETKIRHATKLDRKTDSSQKIISNKEMIKKPSLTNYRAIESRT